MSMSASMHFTEKARVEAYRLEQSEINALSLYTGDGSQVVMFLSFDQLKQMRDSIEDYLDAEDKESHQVVILSTSGHTIVFKGSKNECKEYCDLYEWIYVDKCGFDWDLEIEEAINE